MPPMSRGLPQAPEEGWPARARRGACRPPRRAGNSVFTSPGAMALTRTFFGPHSAARLRTSWWRRLSTCRRRRYCVGEDAADRADSDEAAARTPSRCANPRQRHPGEPERALDVVREDLVEGFVRKPVSGPKYGWWPRSPTRCRAGPTSAARRRRRGACSSSLRETLQGFAMASSPCF